MTDEHYVNPRLAAIYDINSGWSADRDFYLGLADSSPQRILDIGCGTGLIADRYAARGHAVTGADPAEAMLAVARQKPHGAAIAWVRATAEDFRSDQRFDLIIMTGHAFQVLLDDAAVSRAFATVREHLAPGGRFVFESRNPAIDWASRWSYDESEVDAAGTPVRLIRDFLGRDGEYATFEQVYVFPDETLRSESTLRFMAREAIETLIAAAGLEVDAVLGEWDGSPFTGVEEEMIFLTRRAA
jgi:SAM-dependent methyltransferase